MTGGAGDRNLKPVFLTLAIVALLLVIGGGAYYIVRYGPLAHKANAPAANAETLTPAQELVAAKEALQAASTPKDAARAHEQLGNAYMANNQPDQAITEYQSAEATDSSEKIQAEGDLVGAYLQSGDKEKAIAAIRQLIPLLQASSDPADHALVPRYQSLILEIQARP